MTGIIPIGVTESGCFKKYSEAYSHSAYAESTKAGSFVGTKAGLSHDVQFFSCACAMK